jgi:16S rRNA (adenine1518-N6/adenine1519-N6)-dimethyltransferase
MITAKKSLGQHFLQDENMARKIAETFLSRCPTVPIVEVGPGLGALTKYLLANSKFTYHAVEADWRMVEHLANIFPDIRSVLFHEDFLLFDFSKLKSDSVSVIGNFPYNISSQILFKVYEERDRVPFLVGMFQKEVALRIAAAHGNKEYGILSVLMQAFYEVTCLFEVHEQCFSPPPKVKSAVIQLVRKKNPSALKNESLFRALVKAGFNQRRKTLRNSLAQFLPGQNPVSVQLLSRRAEQLSVYEWIDLANDIAS